MHNNKRLQLGGPLLATCLTLAYPAALPAQELAAAQLLELSIEELSELPVTSALRRPEPLSESASAIFVITAEDIRRSGATNIPELLRLVPGMQVAQIDSRRWAVSARGFAGAFSNKLLVQIDGRSVYTPVHSGVNWDMQDTFLAEIERIEVIRGPGAVQWGANAVNGIINIITKSSHDTHGGFASLLTGSETDMVAGRQGGPLGAAGSYRVYGKYQRNDAAEAAPGAIADGDWWQGRVGFRSDWEGRDRFTLQGDLYQTDESEVSSLSSLIAPADQPDEFDDGRGGNLLGRWTRRLAEENELSLQAYVDWYEANPLLVREEVITADLEFQHAFRLGAAQQIVWGLGYRRIRDEFASSRGIYLEPSRQTTELFSLFLQDTVTVAERVAVTLGAKLEHHDYTGAQLQPSLRLAWTPTRQHTVWGAVSRAVRTPSRGERDLRASLRGGVARFSGNRELKAEELIAYELGYRVSPLPELFVDLTVFRHEYEDVVGNRPYALTADGLYSEYVNGVAGRSEGLELAARWQARRNWRLDLAYTYLNLRLDAPGLDPVSASPEDTHPQHQLSLFSRLDLSPRWQLDAWLRYVDRLPGFTAAQSIPDYTALDLRLGWQASPRTLLSLVGQNLLDPQHPEFTRNIEIERAVYLRLDQQF